MRTSKRQARVQQPHKFVDIRPADIQGRRNPNYIAVQAGAMEETFRAKAACGSVANTVETC